jgi:PAS domain-containing protein
MTPDRSSIDAAVNVDLAAEVERLHALLDQQPSCLMRAGLDGTLLAVSATALDLLGSPELAQMLGTNLVDRLRGDARAVWADFVLRVSESGSGSAECEMEDLRGARRTVILWGVAVPDHPDGVPSLMVTVRDMSTARRLETSLQEQEGVRRALQASLDDATATITELRDRLEYAATERRQLGAALEASVAERHRIAIAVDQLTSALNLAIDAASTARRLIAKEAAE